MRHNGHIPFGDSVDYNSSGYQIVFEIGDQVDSLNENDQDYQILKLAQKFLQYGLIADYIRAL